MADGFKPILARLVEGHPLTSEQAHDFFAACLRGEPTPSQVAAAVTALRIRGETVDEIAAFARNITGEKNMKGVIENYMAPVFNEPRIIGVSLSGKL
jgi:anthranilate phosphoribosyltransferase